MKLSIEEELKIGFTELKGKSLNEIEQNAYQRWQKSVKELRDSVVHRGSAINEKQAREARKAVFDLMTKIDPTVMDNLRVKQETTCLAFGVPIATLVQDILMNA